MAKVKSQDKECQQNGAQVLNNYKNLLILQQIKGHIHKLQSNQGTCPYYTVINNGATHFLVGNVHWVMLKEYNSCIGVDGPVGLDSTMTL